MGEELSVMLAALDGRPRTAAVDWRSCRATLRGVLDMLDDAGEASSLAAIHVADALVQVEHSLACQRLAA